MNKIIPAILIYKEGFSAFFLTGSPQDLQIPQYRPCSPQFWQLACCKWQSRSFVFFWPLTGRWNANAHLPSTASAAIIGICFAFGAGQLVERVRSAHGFTEANLCQRSRTPTSNRKTQRRQQPRCRNTTTVLRPSAVSEKGGGGEISQVLASSEIPVPVSIDHSWPRNIHSYQSTCCTDSNRCRRFFDTFHADPNNFAIRNQTRWTNQWLWNF